MVQDKHSLRTLVIALTTALLVAGCATSRVSSEPPTSSPSAQPSPQPLPQASPQPLPFPTAPSPPPAVRENADAQAMLRQIIAESWFTARAVFGLWPANSEGDDILIFADEARNAPMAVLHTLRQQLPRREGRANVALADFVAPRASGLADYVGAFAVTAGIGEEAVADRFKRANDDYSAIMAKALADRLAEALAEYLHRRVRREFWAYAPDEALSGAELIAEKYRGIRPAPGYPAQPDHSEKATLFASPRRRAADRRAADRKLCHVARRIRFRPLFQPSGKLLFRRRPHRARSGRRLRDAQELDLRAGRKMAGADPELRSARRMRNAAE